MINLTEEECRALPVLEALQFESRVIDGRRVQVPRMTGLRPVFVSEASPLLFADATGQWWKVCKAADGTIGRCRTGRA